MLCEGCIFTDNAGLHFCETLKADNASCIFNAVDSPAPCISVDELKKRSEVVDTMWMSVADTARTNSDTATKEAYEVPEAIVEEGRRDLHTVNTCVSEAIEMFDLINSSYCLFNSFQHADAQTNMLLAFGRLCQQIEVLHQPPPLDAAPFSNWLLKNTFGRLLIGDEHSPDAAKACRLHKKVFSGRLWMGEKVHYCWGECGEQCHSNRGEVIADALEFFCHIAALMFDPAGKPSDKGFFKILDYVRSWACACGTHFIGSRAISMVFQSGGPDEDTTIMEADGMKTKSRKRQSRSRAFIQNPDNIASSLDCLDTCAPLDKVGGLLAAYAFGDRLETPMAGRK